MIHHDTHAARNDAQLLVLRQTKPAIWARLLETATEAERRDIERRCKAAELAAFAAAWDERALSLARVAAALRGEQPEAVGPRCPKCGHLFDEWGRCGCSPRAPARMHVTAQMLADIWQDGRAGEVAQLLAGLDDGERNRLETDYLKLLRARGHKIRLRVVKGLFALTILRAA